MLETCPIDLRPKYHTQGSMFKFTNGSRILLRGSNNKSYDDLRGGKFHLGIVDEAAYVDDLSDLVEKVIRPAVEKVTDGKIILSSTPQGGHAFEDYCRDAEINGYFHHATRYDVGEPKEAVDKLKADVMSKPDGDITWRQEYMAERNLVSQQKLIIPEFKDEFVQSIERTRYFHFYHKYEGMDEGVRDNTAILFAYYDFNKAKLIIEDQIVVNGQDSRTDLLAKDIKEKENELNYTDLYYRVSDTNARLIQDLACSYDVYFSPISKTDLHEMVNEARIWIKQGRVLINPKCVDLINCLKYGQWDKERKAFQRMEHLGHLDSLAALIYLLRVIDQQTNPVPITFNFPPEHSYIPAEAFETEQSKDIKRVFNVEPLMDIEEG